MADPVRNVYWDTSLFISFLNRNELDRRSICEENLQHAKAGELNIYTSMWTIVEVIRPNRTSLPSAAKLTPGQIDKIQKMFEWEWLRKIQVDQRVAIKAVELARNFGLKPADAVHAASAILSPADTLQCWDRDFGKISHLIKVEEPTRLSKQATLFDDSVSRLGPHPDDFKDTP